MRAIAGFWLLLWAVPAVAGTVSVAAYDEKGRMLDTQGLLRRISPAESAEHGVAPQSSALYLTGLDDSPAPGRPWWVADSTLPQWRWSGPERIKISLPWPIAADGFATIELDGDGSGYVDGQTVPLNEDAAKAAWRRFREALGERSKSFVPRFEPTPAFKKAEAQAKAAVVDAQREPDPGRRARLSDKALSRISEAWQTMLFDHGRQTVRDPKTGPAVRFGLTLDESLVDRLPEYAWIAERISKSGATWVRLVFRTNADDFLYAEPHSFSLYDSFIHDLRARNIRIMGSVLDSALWPKGIAARAYVARTRNLVSHYKDSIRSWEVASEPNGSWIGGPGNHLPDEVILEAVNAGAAEAKRIDPSVETVATLYWWEGTAKDDRHPLFNWLKWSVPKGFGRNIDIVGLSVFPDENPLSLAFDPAFLKLRKTLPDKKLMLGGFGYVERDELKGYWWLDPASILDARADILILYSGAACALPQGVGGGFFFATLQQMLEPGEKVTPLYAIYRSTLKQLKP